MNSGAGTPRLAGVLMVRAGLGRLVVIAAGEDSDSVVGDLIDQSMFVVDAF